jgi:hypothetical protein
LLNSAIFIINKESFIRKNEYFEFVEYLNNILFEDDKIYLIFDYVKKINSIISLDILLEKKDWYHLVKDLNEKISSKNIGETTYKTFINAIFPLISEQKLISKRKDWFDIVQYFEKSLRNNEDYVPEFKDRKVCNYDQLNEAKYICLKCSQLWCEHCLKFEVHKTEISPLDQLDKTLQHKRRIYMKNLEDKITSDPYFGKLEKN